MREFLFAADIISDRIFIESSKICNNRKEKLRDL